MSTSSQQDVDGEVDVSAFNDVEAGGRHGDAHRHVYRPVEDWLYIWARPRYPSVVKSALCAVKPSENRNPVFMPPRVLYLPTA